VFEEVLVFNRGHRMDEWLGNLIEAHEAPLLILREVRQQLGVQTVFLRAEWSVKDTMLEILSCENCT
jgi:hypothetical protein